MSNRGGIGFRTLPEESATAGDSTTIGMTYTEHKEVGVALAAPPTDNAEGLMPDSASSPSVAHSVSPGRSVYLDVARAWLPQWLRLIGPSPWYHGGVSRCSKIPTDASTTYRQLSAVLATGVLSEVDVRRPDHAYLCECVRVSLIRWQLSIRGDGQPSAGHMRRNPLRAVIAAQIVQLLSETAGFQTDLLLEDLARHLAWLKCLPPHPPWLEASLIVAMADGALIVRDAELLRLARARLDGILESQDEEGWFPERGGADIGRLSLTVDTLARVYRQTGWDELRDPLRRAVSFLARFINIDGSAGGCYSACDTAFVSPYGLELLASSLPEAVAPALAWRRRCMNLPPDRICALSDDVYAALGASVMLSAVSAEPRLSESNDVLCPQDDSMQFPGAGLSVVSNGSYRAVVSWKRGGALHVAWRNGAPAIEDAGVVVIHAHGTRTVIGPRLCDRSQVTESSVVSSSILGRASRVNAGPLEGLRRWSRSKVQNWRQSRTRRPGVRDRARGLDYHMLAHDWCTRRITFGDDTVHIHDRVRCRLPCESVVVQSPTIEPRGLFVNVTPTDRIGRPPIFVNGGRRVDITRIYRNGELVDMHLG